MLSVLNGAGKVRALTVDDFGQNFYRQLVHGEEEAWGN